MPRRSPRPGEARIDVDDQTVDCAGGVFRFEIDEEIKHRLLHGLDDIAITSQARTTIDAFERSGRGGPRAGDDGAVSRRADRVNTGPREWDAEVYHRVSDTQLDWGMEVLERSS